MEQNQLDTSKQEELEVKRIFEQQGVQHLHCTIENISTAEDGMYYDFHVNAKMFLTDEELNPQLYRDAILQRTPPELREGMMEYLDKKGTAPHDMTYGIAMYKIENHTITEHNTFELQAPADA